MAMRSNLGTPGPCERSGIAFQGKLHVVQQYYLSFFIIRKSGRIWSFLVLSLKLKQVRLAKEMNVHLRQSFITLSFLKKTPTTKTQRKQPCSCFSKGCSFCICPTEVQEITRISVAVRMKDWTRHRSLNSLINMYRRNLSLQRVMRH